jgi:DNA-3-methyladenine glycosylase I
VSAIVHADGRRRCEWPGEEPIYLAYHDVEWGVPERDDRALFEKLILDGFQAGLSWITILKKRQAFRAAFAGFEPAAIARYGERDVARLMGDAGIVRNRAKIEATVANARAWLTMQSEGPGFSRYLWDFVDGAPIVNRRRGMVDLPAETELSKAISKDMKARGFRFCGPTIVYAFMQAVGMVNDHAVTCYRHQECANLAAGLSAGD